MFNPMAILAVVPMVRHGAALVGSPTGSASTGPQLDWLMLAGFLTVVIALATYLCRKGARR